MGGVETKSVFQLVFRAKGYSRMNSQPRHVLLKLPYRVEFLVQVFSLTWIKPGEVFVA
jgi:hypothetical protein